MGYFLGVEGVRCLSQSNIPNITPTITLTRENAVNLLLASTALEELGLSHIINAEGEKLQFVLGTMPGLSGPTGPTGSLTPGEVLFLV